MDEHITLKDMECLYLEKGDVVIVRPKEGFDVRPEVLHKSLARLSKETDIKFLLADMVDVSVLRKSQPDEVEG